MINLESSVDRYNNISNLIKKIIFFYMTLTFKMSSAMMLIAHRSFFFTALQFVVITSYYVSLRLAKKKQQRTLNITQLRILGLKIPKPSD